MTVTPTYPGVYIREIPSGSRTITGVATSITAFVGTAPRAARWTSRCRSPGSATSSARSAACGATAASATPSATSSPTVAAPRSSSGWCTRRTIRTTPTDVRAERAQIRLAHRRVDGPRPGGHRTGRLGQRRSRSTSRTPTGPTPTTSPRLKEWLPGDLFNLVVREGSGRRSAERDLPQRDQRRRPASGRPGRSPARALVGSAVGRCPKVPARLEGDNRATTASTGTRSPARPTTSDRRNTRPACTRCSRPTCSTCSASRRRPWPGRRRRGLGRGRGLLHGAAGLPHRRPARRA